MFSKCLHVTRPIPDCGDGLDVDTDVGVPLGGLAGQLAAVAVHPGEEEGREELKTGKELYVFGEAISLGTLAENSTKKFGDSMDPSLFWSVQKTSNIGDILTQAVYTSNPLKSKVLEF